MNKSNNITREEMWAKQCLSATDIDYAVWERDKSILHQLSKICHNCTFVVDVYNAVTRMLPRISLIYWGMTVTR